MASRTAVFNRVTNDRISFAETEGPPSYNPDTALALPNDVMDALGLQHFKKITPAQRAGYEYVAKTLATNGKLSWQHVIEVETNALIIAGMDADLARRTVERAIKPLRDAGMEPTSIPWGGH